VFQQAAKPSSSPRNAFVEMIAIASRRKATTLASNRRRFSLRAFLAGLADQRLL
jgi:hypothetical protein